MRRHNDRYFQIGANIQFYRRRKAITQETLAEMVGVSRTHISNIEAPNMDQSLSLQTLFDIADALEIEPSKLLEFRD